MIEVSLNFILDKITIIIFSLYSVLPVRVNDQPNAHVQVNFVFVNPLSANPSKLSNTLKQLVGKLPTNCLSVFERFVGLTLKRLQDVPLNTRVLRY